MKILCSLGVKKYSEFLVSCYEPAGFLLLKGTEHADQHNYILSFKFTT